MRLQWTESAEKDLDSIEMYYQKTAGQRVAADNVLKIITSAKTLLEMPNRSRAGRVPNTRELVLTELPFVLPYRMKNDVIQILRVFHTAQKLPEWW